MILYKLTDENNKTRVDCPNELTWGNSVTHEVSNKVLNPVLCTDQVIHAYRSYKLGLFMNYNHANFNEASLKVWKCSGKIVTEDEFKCGVLKLTTLNKIEFKIPSSKQKIYFGILCAKQVFKENSWIKWANNWISGKDRSYKSATDAMYAANSASPVFYDNNAIRAASAATNAATNAAYYATYYAANVTGAAYYAATHAATNATTNIAYYTTVAAYYAAYDANFISKHEKHNFIKLANKAYNWKE